MGKQQDDYRGNGNDHRVYVRACTLVYWGNGGATGYKGADKVEAMSPFGTSIEFILPVEEDMLKRFLIMMEEAWMGGKRQAKLELRRWLEIQ